MGTCPRPIDNLEDLQNYVTETICCYGQLEYGAYHVTHMTLRRGDRPCGIYFCLHGPRAVKLTAIWEADGNTILFYDADGRRYQRTQLAAAPPLEELAV